MTPEEILAFTDHRPWPLPQMPWVMTQRWSDLLFAHWALPASLVRERVPKELELDLFDGKAWVGLAPFRMAIQVRGLPPLPGAHEFLEMNLRTYVRLRRETSGSAAERHAPGAEPGDAQSMPGVYFFSLDASNLPAVVGARVGLGLPYFWADMAACEEAGVIAYASRRKDGTGAVQVRYAGGETIAVKSELDRFLTERYCLYEVRLGMAMRTQIHHMSWPLQKAEAEFAVNELGDCAGIPLRGKPDTLHFSKALDVLIYPPG